MTAFDPLTDIRVILVLVLLPPILYGLGWLISRLNKLIHERGDKAAHV